MNESIQKRHIFLHNSHQRKKTIFFSLKDNLHFLIFEIKGFKTNTLNKINKKCLN